MGKAKQTYYSESIKWQIVKDVLAGKYTKEEARRIYGIKSKCAVLYWIRKFSGNSNYRTPSEFESGSTIMKNRISEKIHISEIKKLEEELSRERQRSELWKAMVEIAEEELGVDIRKKFGAKQLLELKKKAEKNKV